MSMLISLAELETCLRRKPWQTRAEIEKELGGNIAFPLEQGIRLGEIIEQVTRESIKYAMRPAF